MLFGQLPGQLERVADILQLAQPDAETTPRIGPPITTRVSAPKSDRDVERCLVLAQRDPDFLVWASLYRGKPLAILLGRAWRIGVATLRTSLLSTSTALHNATPLPQIA
jgi:hypothetical protein